MIWYMIKSYPHPTWTRFHPAGDQELRQMVRIPSLKSAISSTALECFQLLKFQIFSLSSFRKSWAKKKHFFCWDLLRQLDKALPLEVDPKMEGRGSKLSASLEEMGDFVLFHQEWCDFWYTVLRYIKYIILCDIIQQNMILYSMIWYMI